MPAEGISISLDGQLEGDLAPQESYLDMRLRWGLDTDDVSHLQTQYNSNTQERFRKHAMIIIN